MTTLTVGIVGLGVIGQRWAACFAHAGYAVRGFDPAPESAAAFRQALPGLMADLDALKGPSPSAGAIDLFPTLAEALGGVGFVQENGPEDLALKRRLLAEIERHVDDDVVIASSSSALLVSDMQSECRVPGRIVLGHPFNPAHLMPLVEIVGGRTTNPGVTVRARAFYEGLGKKPVTLNREVTGHLALRLMGAMWREAIALVREGVASAEDVDRAFMYGPGPKWTLQGSFISNSLNAEDMESFLRRYGPTYQAIWDTLLDARLDEETIRAVAASTQAAAAGRSRQELAAEREAGLVGLLKTVAEHGAL